MHFFGMEANVLGRPEESGVACYGGFHDGVEVFASEPEEECT